MRGHRYPLSQKLREALALAKLSRHHGIPWQEAAEKQREFKAVSRRKFLTATLAATAGFALPLCAGGRSSSPRIAVIGAGLAGLRFAHVLWTRKGLASTIYEANTRLGGRCWTNRDFFLHGQVAEHGGEFISSEHSSMRGLAQQFGLHLIPVYGGSEPVYDDVCWLDESYYTVAELNADLSHLLPIIGAARRAAPYPTLYNSYTKAGYELDHISCTDWIAENVRGGIQSKLGRILLCNQIGEYGCEPDVQPALNLIYLISGLGTGGLAGTDEKYRVAGGNDQIPAIMADQLPSGSIKTGMSLRALARRSDGTYDCSFAMDSTTVEVTADHVVLALPFNQLRKVDLSKAGLSPVKLAAINGYNLGTNAKLALQFDGRPWARPDHWSGVCYTAPEDFQLSWDATVSQPGPQGILLRFPGGDAGGANAFPGAVAHGSAPAPPADDFLTSVSRPFPGCAQSYNGKAWLDWWAQDDFIGGAYGCYQLGDYTSFAGIEGASEGNIHFCGEQTSLDFQGFMEGALRSAESLALYSGIF